MRIATRLSAFVLLAIAVLAFGGPAASEYRLAAPSAPTNVQATQGTHGYHDRIKVTFSAPDANSYRVYRQFEGGVNWTVYARVSGTEYYDYGAHPNYKYDYRVRACATSSWTDCSALSDVARGWLDAGLPGNLQASDGAYTNKVRITWNESPNATAYKLYRGTGTQGYNSGPITLNGVSYTSWDEMNIVPGRYYYWWVRGYNSHTGDYSSFGPYNRGWQQLTAPLDFAAGDGLSCSQTRLVWDYVEGATSYSIYRGNSPSSYTEEWSVGQTTDEFNDFSGNASQVYYYWVKARSTETGHGPSSGSDTGFRGVPPAPSGIFATDGTIANRVNIHWGARTGAIYYRLYRGTNPSFVVSLQDYIQGTSYDDYSAVPGTVYYYRVASRNGCGSGDTGTYDSGYRPTPTTTTMPSVTPQPTSTRTPEPTSQAPPPTETATPTATIYFRPTDYTWLPLTLRSGE